MQETLDFLKKLIESGNRKLTVVLFHDESPESSNSYKITPSKLLFLFYGSLVVVVIMVLLLVMFTPFGSVLYNHEDEELRASAIEISEKVSSLQDSLRSRDRQLYEMQTVLSDGTDTTFSTSEINLDESLRDPSMQRNEEVEAAPTEMISKNDVIFSNLLKEAPDFPAPYPVEGTLTRDYNYGSGHFGVDIATSNETVFRAIADGSVVNQEWTVSYGYVLHIQHRDGIISVYKHAASLTKNVGDIIIQGDVLGTVGDTGVVSSGPHLHLEIWKDGVPQNPLLYLLKS